MTRGTISITVAGVLWLAPTTCIDIASPRVEPRESPSASAAASVSPSGSWSTGAPMPIPKNEVAAVGFDGRVYVLGGYSGADCTYTANSYFV